jgi:hypothetical protein
MADYTWRLTRRDYKDHIRPLLRQAADATRKRQLMRLQGLREQILAHPTYPKGARGDPHAKVLIDYIESVLSLAPHTAKAATLVDRLGRPL